MIGGGDSALQEALTLSNFVARTIIINSAAELTGQAAYKQLLEEKSNIEVRNGASVQEILGGDAVTGLRISDGSTVETNGVFVYIGLAPEAKFLDGHLKLDAGGAVPTDAAMRTRLKGICAAGTVRAGAAGRAAASAGDGTVAAVTIDRYLADGSWPV